VCLVLETFSLEIAGVSITIGIQNIEIINVLLRELIIVEKII